jgi:hypothetical protein
MAIRIEPGYMALEVDGAVVATARFSHYGAWIVSTHPVPLFTTGQAITALALAGRLAAGYGGGDPFVVSWRAELFR